LRTKKIVDATIHKSKFVRLQYLKHQILWWISYCVLHVSKW